MGKADAERNGSILATIETLRDLDFDEEEIKRKIMVKYGFIEEQARDYMLKKST